MNILEQSRNGSGDKPLQGPDIQQPNIKDNKESKLLERKLTLGKVLKAFNKKPQVEVKREKTRNGPTFKYQPLNISNQKITDVLTWEIAKRLEGEKWMHVGRELGLKNATLQQIQKKHKDEWIDCAYEMLQIWKEQKPNIILEELFTALERLKWKAPITEITKHVKKQYLTDLKNKPVNIKISKWSNVNPRIQQSILSKMTLQSYLNCTHVSKYWMDRNRQFYTALMLQNCPNWSESYFRTVRDVHRKNRGKMTKSQPPILKKKADSIDHTQDTTISNETTSMAVGHNEKPNDTIKTGPTSGRDYQDTSKAKIDVRLIREISKCMNDEKWIDVGRELGVEDDKLEQIKINNKEQLAECAYQMLVTCKEKRPDSTLQDLFTALEKVKWEAPIAKITKRVKIHLIGLANESANTSTSKWSNLNTKILLSILSKMTLKCNLICNLVSKHWMKNAQEFYTFWMKKNSNNWSECSFSNAMNNNVNCKKIYCKSSEEWKISTAPTLIREMITIDHFRGNINISNDGTLLALSSDEIVRIYDLTDSTMKFSKQISDGIHGLHFNATKSCILVESGSKLQALTIEEGLPSTLSVKCSNESVGKPWWTEDIFLSGNYDEKKDRTTFYMNEVGKKKSILKRNTTQCPVLMVKGQADRARIVQKDNGIVLVCRAADTKMVFITLSDFEFTKYQSKQQPETPDHKVDCQGEIRDFIDVPDGNTKKVYVLTKMKQNDYCFLIMDLDSFHLQTSTLLVPFEFTPWRNLVSSDKYIAIGSRSNCAFIWDIQSGHCVAQLKHEVSWVSCVIHPIDPKQVITAGMLNTKLKFWQLNTDEVK